MNCPLCSVTLVIAERRGVEIDHCPKCRGVWLDRGELDKLISVSESSERDIRPISKGEHFDDDDDYYKRSDYFKHKRKKSLLKEVFDF